MSYKFDNITFMNKKSPLKSMVFDAPGGHLTDLFVPKKEQHAFVKKVLKGEEKVATGRYQIDGQDMVGQRFVKSKIEVVGKDKWIDRLVPPKTILYTSLLFDANFLRHARVNSNNKKFDHLSLLETNNDLGDLKLRKSVDKAILQFVTDSVDAERKLLNEYSKKIDKINEEKSEQIFGNYYVQIKVLSKQAASLTEELANSELLLTFYQSLWDKIYSLDELRNSCTCEYNVKESSNKEMKKNKSKFRFQQTKWVVKKQLKLINVRTSELRINIYRLRKMLGRVKKQLELEIKKYHNFNNISSDQRNRVEAERKSWAKLNTALRVDFEKQQKVIFFDLLTTESAMLAKRIVFMIHDYHTKVLASEIELGDPLKFKEMKKHSKYERVTILSQIRSHTNSTLEKYGMKMSYFKNIFKFSSLNFIYIKMLKAINMGKNNIILTNRIGLLSRKDISALGQTMIKMCKDRPELTFISLTDAVTEIPSVSRVVYSTNLNDEIKAFKLSELYVQDAQMFRDRWYNTWNTMNYRRTETGLEIENKIWNIDNNDYKPFGKVFINPFEVSTADTNTKGQLPILIKIKQSNKFVDTDMHFGVTEAGHRLSFFSKDTFELNKEYVIYLQANAVADKF